MSEIPDQNQPGDWRAEARRRQEVDRRLARKRAEATMGGAKAIMTLCGTVLLVMHLVFFFAPLDVLGKKLARPNKETLEEMSPEDRALYQEVRTSLINKVQWIHGCWAAVGLLLGLAGLFVGRFPLALPVAALLLVIGMILGFGRDGGFAHVFTYVMLVPTIPLLGKCLYEGYQFHQKEREFRAWRDSLQ